MEDVKYQFLCGVVGGLGPKASSIFYDKNIVEGRIQLHKALNSGVDDVMKAVSKVSTANWTADELKRLQQLFPSEGLCDQDHPPIMIYGNSQVAERPDYILRKSGPDPAPELVRTCQKLQAAGASAVGIVCNTAHYFMPQILPKIDVEFIDMLKLTFEYVLRSLGKGKIGLLGTDASVKTRIFHVKSKQVSDKIEVLSPRNFDRFNLAVFSDSGVKGGCTGVANLQLVLEDARELIAQGAKGIILGCTELPLLFTPENIKAIRHKPGFEFVSTMHFINPAKVLADEIMKRTLLSKNTLDI